MPTPHAELLSLIARADQLVTEADEYLQAVSPPHDPLEHARSGFHPYAVGTSPV